MGTSYYLYLKETYEIIKNNFKSETPANKLLLSKMCELFSFIRIKIGKNCAGWKFCLRIYPLLNVNSFEDWLKIFQNEKFIIIDENGRIIEAEEIIDIITKKESFFKKEDIGKLIDGKYLVSEVGLIEHSDPEFIVVNGETYDYFICYEGIVN